MSVRFVLTERWRDGDAPSAEAVRRIAAAWLMRELDICTEDACAGDGAGIAPLGGGGSGDGTAPKEV